MSEFMLVALAPRTPSDPEWSELVSDVDRIAGRKAVIIVANDMRPSPKQRGDIQKWGEDGKTKICVLTDSVKTRGAVTAIRWFKAEIRAFSEHDTPAGLAWAGVPENQLRDAQAEIGRLKQALGIPATASAADR